MGRSHVNYFRRALFRRPHNCDSFQVKRSEADRRPGEIKLFSDPMIRNISYPIRKARRAFGMWLWFCRSCAQETFGQRLDDERTRSNSGLKIPFCMKPREREVDGEP